MGDSKLCNQLRMGRTLTFLLFCLTLTCSGQFNFQDPAFLTVATAPAASGGGGGTDINQGLSWRVPMDEGTGNTATNSVAGRSSITSLSLHMWTNGVFNNALSWTTTDTRTPNGGDSGIGGLTKASFSVWFRRALSTDRCYMSYLSADATLTLGAVISWRDDNLCRLTFTNGQNVAMTLSSSTLNTWKHIVWTYDAGAGGTHTNWVRGYVDGVPQNMTFTGTVPTFIHSAATNSYPMLNLVGGNYYIGQIDAPRVYTNIVIGTDVISSLYTNQ